MITSPADTLVCDTTQLAVWQSDPAYDYGRELMAPDINVFEWFNRWFGKILQKIFGSHFAEEYSELILIGIAILLFNFDNMVRLQEATGVIHDFP